VDAIIIGGGIGGLTLALALHRAGIACRVYEAAPEIKPIGVGINLLPHAMQELAGLGLEATLAARGVITSEAVFFNRFGQLIYREPLAAPPAMPGRRSPSTAAICRWCWSMPFASGSAPTG